MLSETKMMRKTDWFHLSVDGWMLSIHSYLSDKMILARFTRGEVVILKPFNLETKDFEYSPNKTDWSTPRVSLEVCNLFARLALE